MSWALLHHPAFQSLCLPALLGGLCTLLLQRTPGGRRRSWGGFGAPVGLALALMGWPGLVWPAASQAQRFPWLVLLGLLIALGLQVWRREPVTPRPPNRWRATRWALLLVALLVGLGLLAAARGSLLLAQLALMAAASASVPLIWAWARPGSGPRLGALALLPLAVALLALIAMVAALGATPPATGADADDPYYTPRW